MQAHPTVHAYFKSTDGHHGNWAFNLRRPNIHILPIAAAHRGYVLSLVLPAYFSSLFVLSRYLPRLILVDSTRAGKRLPDALSKTVPIWCAVVNRATRMRGLLARRRTTVREQAEEEEIEVDLHTPPGAVSAHEHAQIAARLDSWATALAVRGVTTDTPTAFPLCSTAKNPHPHRIRRMLSRN